MGDSQNQLPSWNPGPTRDRIIGFLDEAAQVPVSDRVAYFDNDGTLWCERPSYIQLDFFVDELRRRVDQDPALGEKPEFAALLNNDKAAIGAIGLARVAAALAGLFENRTPEEFASAVRSFMASGMHPDKGRPLRTMVYQPMIELIEELRRREFTVGIVTGGGTEFVRAISVDLYGVPPELVVGTLIEYEFARDGDGVPAIRRSSRILGDANEGAAKVAHIQTQLGRRPILAGGNSSGDREMLEWAAAVPGPSMALLVNHDDAEREYVYEGTGATVDDLEPITVVADRLSWVQVSMKSDWSTVFAPES